MHKEQVEPHTWDFVKQSPFKSLERFKRIAVQLELVL